MSRKFNKISPDGFGAGEVVPVCENLDVAQARNHRENAALLGLAKLQELWAGRIKPVASVPSGAAQEQQLEQGLLFSLCTLTCPDGVLSLHEIMVRKNHFHALRTGLCWVTGEETASGCAE